MNPWEVVAAKLDRFFFGHDHDTEIVDGAEQLAEAEEREETWLGYDAAGDIRCMYCGRRDGCGGACAGSRAEKQRNGIQTSSTDSRRTASVEDGPTPACDIPLSAGVGHPRIPEPELNSSELVALRQLIEERFGRPL